MSISYHQLSFNAQRGVLETMEAGYIVMARRSKSGHGHSVITVATADERELFEQRGWQVVEPPETPAPQEEATP